MICTKCKTEKPEEEFNWKVKEVKRHSRCRECTRKEVQSHFLKNKDYYRRKAKVTNTKIKDRNKELLKNYLFDKVCSDCGLPDSRVLEFDHLRDKEHDIAQMMHGAFSWKTILEEISKCEIVCANCHRIRTYIRCESGRLTWYS